jgi:hypothetical protein
VPARLPDAPAEAALRTAALRGAPVAHKRPVRALLARGVLGLLGQRAHPPITDDPAFEALAKRTVDPGTGAWIEYDVSAPKIAFLQWLRTNRPVVFHGSMRDDIDVLKPIRLSRDTGAFGDQQAVYASDDPVWAMYFAVLRKQGLRWTKNSCSRVVGDGRDRLPRYAFAIDPEAPMDGRLGSGTIYVLPREAFQAEAPLLGVIDPCHLVAKGEVPVLAKLRVEPEDFPFADAIFRAGRVGELRFALAHWRARAARTR